jgi:glycosyltransferase involved in cell wall biosynthesis
MHIGFDISQTGDGKAGCGYYAHAMIEALIDVAPQNRYSLFPSFGDFYFDKRMPMRNPYQRQFTHYGPRHLTRESARMFWSSDNIEDQISKPDIIHSNNFWCPVQVELARLFYTFYDLGFLIDPSWSTEANRIGCFEGVFRSSVAADCVVAISKASRSHYLEVFPHFPEERIRVIYPCSRFKDSELVGTPPPALTGVSPGAFWLSVGTIEPRKNQYKLAEAYARYRVLGGENLPLVFAGGKGWLMDGFKTSLSDLGIENDVILTGYITDDELIWLYRNCYANLYPSLFEGFGLPVLEGMQFGAATLTSDSTSLPEVAGEAAVMLSPDDTEGWAQAMLDLGANPDKKNWYSQMGRERAKLFSWVDSAKQLLDLYEEIVAIPKREIQQPGDADTMGKKYRT